MPTRLSVWSRFLLTVLSSLLLSSTPSLWAGLRFDPVPTREGAAISALATDGVTVWAGSVRGVWAYSAGKWVLDGLEQEPVRSLAFADGSLWAVTQSSLYRRRAAGAYEKQTLPAEALSIVVLASRGADVFAGGSGLYKYSGGTWVSVPGLGVRAVTSLLVSGSDLYAGFSFGGAGRFDGLGWTFLQSTSFPPGEPVQSLGISGGKLYAGLSRGIYSWTLPSGPWAFEGLARENIKAISAFSGTLRVATESSGVQKLTGTAWTAENAGLSTLSTTALFTWGTDLLLATGGGPVYRLSGTSWLVFGSGLSGQVITALSSGTPWSSAFCGGSAGSAFSGGAGTGVTPANPPGQAACLPSTYALPDPCSAVKALAPAVSSQVLVATECGTYFVNELSASLNNNGLGTDPRLTSLVSTPQGILASHQTAGVFRFLGSSWTDDSNGLPNDEPIQKVGFAGTTAYAAVTGRVFARQASGRWANISSGLPAFSLVSGITGDDPVYAGLATGGVYKREGSLPWKKDAYGLGSQVVLGIEQSAAGLFAAAGEAGVARKVDGGWLFEREGLPEGTETAVVKPILAEKQAGLQATERRLYAGTRGRGLFSASLIPAFRTFPVILDAPGVAGSRFRTELVLGNLSSKSANAKLYFVPAPGYGGTSLQPATVTQTVGPKSEVRIADSIEYLRSKGVPIPSGQELSIIGSLSMAGDWADDPGAGTADLYGLARTYTRGEKGGTFGVSYNAPADLETAEGEATVYGLRQGAGVARSNLALVALPGRGTDPVTLSVSVFTKDGVAAGQAITKTLKPGEWTQYNDILKQGGLPDGASGYVRVTRTAGKATWTSYGSVADAFTSDGSFLPGFRPGGLTVVRRQIVPVVLDVFGQDGARFTTEVTIVNGTGIPTPVDLYYQPAPDYGADQAGGPPVTVLLAAHQQLTIPDVIQFLRENGVFIPDPAVSGPQAGTLLADFRFLQNLDTGNTAVLARTSTPNPDKETGGSFGLFYKSVAEGGGARRSALVPGLSQNSGVRSNLGVLHTGGGSEDEIELTVQLYQAETGAPLGKPLSVRLLPGDWSQWNRVIELAGIIEGNAYAIVTKTAGDGNFYAYGVLNDNTTSDGSFVEMIPFD